MKLTPMQNEAVHHPLSNILVTAAAGSGKTQVLTGRIIDRIQTCGADISKMLIITFTNAAAAEMRGRISKKISEAAASDRKNKRLLRQLALVPGADISTVHSFCLKVLRTYFYATGTDPSFSIADESDVKIMKAEALSEAFEYFYDINDEKFLKLISLVCDPKNDNAAVSMVEKIWAFSESDPFPEKWLDMAERIYSELDEENAPFVSILKEKALLHLLSAEKLMTRAIDTASTRPELFPYTEKFTEELAIIKKAIDSQISYNDLFRALDIKFANAPIIRNVEDVSIKEHCRTLRSKALKHFESAASFISMPLHDAVKETRAMADCVSALVSAVRKAEELYQSYKAEKNVLDFSDLEHLTIKTLTKEDEDGRVVPSEIALELRDHYEEIYVDEYQDTNLIQEIIFKMISSESKGVPNIFMVGDMKQSIYRFRMTDPKRIFGEKSNSYKDVRESTDKDKYIKIPLAENFRSRAEILDAVNSVFDLLMTEKLGEVEYKGDERLKFGDSGAYTNELSLPAAELKILVSEYKTGAAKMRHAQAEYLSERIKELMNKGITVYDKDINGYRPLSYRDFAVLLRVTSGNALLFSDVLSSHHIPVFSDTGYSFFDGAEIRVLISLLKIIDNPLQDINLVTVLRSPLFSFGETLLAEYALLKKPYLYDAIYERSQNGDKKAAYFIKSLKRWRRAAQLMNISDFICYLTDDTKYSSFVSALPDSELHLSNINYMIHLARSYDSSSHGSLFNFISYVDKLESKGDPLSPSLPSESTDAVRIMSIHKSKGLEFPFVFVCCTESPIRSKDSGGDLNLHRDLGIGINAFTEERYKFPLPLNRSISALSETEALSEELRVLYVALTRAREHLEVIGSVALKKDEDHYILPDKDEDLLSSHAEESSSMLEWMTIAAVRSDKIVTSVIAATEAAEEESGDRKLEEVVPDNNYGEFEPILSYTYPDLNLSFAKNKYSVSEIKASSYERDNYNNAIPGKKVFMPKLKKPGFINSDKVFTSAQKGSIMHYIMQHIDFSNSDIKGQIDKLNLTPDEKLAVDYNKIKDFMASPLGKKMAGAQSLFREAPFTFRYDGDETLPEGVLIQGIIDCYFIEEDGIVLVDYKTDANVTPDIIKERYALQLELYAMALSKKYNMPVKEKFIYMFDSNETVNL